MYSYGPPHMAVQKQDDQHEHAFSSYVRIRDVVLKTCLGRWTIGGVAREGQGYPCYQRDMTMMVMITVYNIPNNSNFSCKKIHLGLIYGIWELSCDPWVFKIIKLPCAVKEIWLILCTKRNRGSMSFINYCWKHRFLLDHWS